MENSEILNKLHNLKKDIESIIKKIEILENELHGKYIFSENDKKGSLHHKQNINENFINYLLNFVDLKERTINYYLSDLKKLRKLIFEFLNIELTCEIIEINDLNYLRHIDKKLRNNNSFCQYNKMQHHRFSAAFNSYLKFLMHQNDSFEFEDYCIK